MTEENKPASRFKFDFTINLATLTSLAVIGFGAVTWVNEVNHGLKEVDANVKTMAQLVADQADTRKQIESIRAEILINREETLKNRRVYQGEER